jgi:hypothetical protein
MEEEAIRGDGPASYNADRRLRYAPAGGHKLLPSPAEGHVGRAVNGRSVHRPYIPCRLHEGRSEPAARQLRPGSTTVPSRRRTEKGIACNRLLPALSMVEVPVGGGT